MAAERNNAFAQLVGGAPSAGRRIAAGALRLCPSVHVCTVASLQATSFRGERVRLRRITTSTAILIATGSLTPVVAHAAAVGVTLYVNNAPSARCSDSGIGSSTAPYCTIQAAVNAAKPGTTVLVE